LCWLHKDYAGVVKVLTEKRETILTDAASVDRLTDRLIRSLIRLKQMDQALRYAKMSTQVDGDPSGEATMLTVEVDPGSLLVRVKNGTEGR